MRLIYPLESPVRTRGFYYRASFYILGQHLADDYVPRYGAALGVPIKAVHTGAVIGDAWDPYSGYFIMVQGDDGFVSIYRHLRTDAPPVVGQRVQQGEVIGYVGNTGLSEGAHLHFDLWHKVKQDSTAVYKRGWWAHNPALYLGKGNTVVPIEEEDMPLNDADKKWIKDEIGAAFGRFVGPRQPGTLAQVLRTRNEAAYQDLIHAVSMAAAGGIPPVQPSPVADLIRTHSRTPHGGSDGLDLASLRITQIDD